MGRESGYSRKDVCCLLPEYQHLLPPSYSIFSQVEFKISQMALSGLKVNRLDLYGEVCVECVDNPLRPLWRGVC